MGKEKHKRKNKKQAQGLLILPIELIVYCGLRLLLVMANFLPYFAVPVLGRWLGATLRFFDRKHAKIARKNLELSVDVVKAEEIPRVLRQVYTNLGMAILEMLMLPKLLARNKLSELFDLRRLDIFDQCLEQGKGCLVVVGHMGNYELGGVVVANKGYPLNSLARPINNRFIDRYVTGIRSKTGNKIVPTDRAIVEMLRVLRRNEILVIEVDMDAKYDGILVDFCGRPASTYRSPALFGIKCGSPIVMINSYRENGKNVVELTEPIDPKEYGDRDNGVEELTQFIGKRFDESVRQRPEQWLWLLDRWRGAGKLLRRQAEENQSQERPA
jgi:Kdo2-lipid IVA lauroyltransferase/acyltransferase